jgi:hypothetical protein
MTAPNSNTSNANEEPAGSPVGSNAALTGAPGQPLGPSAKSKWLGRMLKIVVLLAVLGCLVLSVAVYFLTRTFNEITGSIGKPEQNVAAPSSSQGS